MVHAFECMTRWGQNALARMYATCGKQGLAGKYTMVLFGKDVISDPICVCLFVLFCAKCSLAWVCHFANAVVAKLQICSEQFGTSMHERSKNRNKISYLALGVLPMCSNDEWVPDSSGSLKIYQVLKTSHLSNSKRYKTWVGMRALYCLDCFPFLPGCEWSWVTVSQSGNDRSLQKRN